ncbi:hypothetical protein SV7mr_27320 [Stieleria bergensis]|uniref:Uncharacterized protein n=1 Tax=Stieleria bergensis TaxID=2528025 RepID=A0A517SVQ7_9BACT|nr:hypothetical protein SV7mr_27320 [Planctomycetes bacterium SV_7m_r]
MWSIKRPQRLGLVQKKKEFARPYQVGAVRDHTDSRAADELPTDFAEGSPTACLATVKISLSQGFKQQNSR